MSSFWLPQPANESHNKNMFASVNTMNKYSNSTKYKSNMPQISIHHNKLLDFIISNALFVSILNDNFEGNFIF